MSLPTKVFQFGCNNTTRLLSSTTGYSSRTAEGAQNKQTGDNSWKSMKTTSPMKENNKQLTREEVTRDNQEKRSKISSAWKQFE
jgi:hypothetical protein